MKHDVIRVTLNGDLIRWLVCTMCKSMWPLPSAIDPRNLECRVKEQGDG